MESSRSKLLGRGAWEISPTAAVAVNIVGTPIHLRVSYPLEGKAAEVSWTGDPGSLVRVF